MENELEPRVLQWDRRTVANLWNYTSKIQDRHDTYFSKQVGQGVARFLEYLAPLRGDVLDYGCGPGFLIDALLPTGMRCSGLDFSTESVESVNARLKGHSAWEGARCFSPDGLPFDDARFDWVTCLETIEHILDEDLPGTLAELARVVKPRTGLLFLTTPNDEHLEASQVFCPNCCNVFHRWQHVRAYTKASLAATLEAAGFETLVCDATNFNYFQQPLHRAAGRRQLPRSIYLEILGVLDRRLSKPHATRLKYNALVGAGPHLFWLGRRI